MKSLGPQNLNWMSYSNFFKKSQILEFSRKNASILSKKLEKRSYPIKNTKSQYRFSGRFFYGSKKFQILPSKQLFYFPFLTTLKAYTNNCLMRYDDINVDMLYIDSHEYINKVNNSIFDKL